MKPGDSAGYSCLDVLRISWCSKVGDFHEECATLLEISESGGVLHTTAAPEDGTAILVNVSENNQLAALVHSSEQDEFGHYLSFHLMQPWFPELYEPAYLLGKPTPIGGSETLKRVDFTPTYGSVA